MVVVIFPAILFKEEIKNDTAGYDCRGEAGFWQRSGASITAERICPRYTVWEEIRTHSPCHGD